MEKVRIVNGPSKEALGLSVIEGKAVEFSIDGLGIVKAIVWSLKSVFNPMGEGTGPHDYVDGKAWIQSPNGKFLNDNDTLHLVFTYYLPKQQGSGLYSQGIPAEVEDMYRQMEEQQHDQSDEGCELCDASLADVSKRFCLNCEDEMQKLREEEECRECGGYSTYPSSGICAECELEQLEQEYAVGMETEADFQASRQ